MQIKTIFIPKNIKLFSKGKYSFNDLDYLNIDLENNLENDFLKLKLDFDFKNSVNLDLINYKKTNTIANLYLDLEKKKENIKINELNFKEGKKFNKY